jgi:hypothetical protein
MFAFFFHVSFFIPPCFVTTWNFEAGLFHTILFQRALGPIKPRDIECSEFDDIQYTRCEHDQLIRKINDYVGVMYQQLERHRHGKMCMAFYSVVNKPGWFGNSEEKVFWERWYLPVRVNSGIQLFAFFPKRIFFSYSFFVFL